MLNNSESENMVPKKCQQFDEYDYKEKQDLDKKKSKAESDKYIFLSPFAFPPPPKKSQTACQISARK